MTDRIEIDYGAVQGINQVLQTRADSIEEQYNLLVRHLTQLEQLWKGQAAEKFFDEMAYQTLPAIQRLQRVLLSTSSALKQVSQVMRAAEEEASNLFKGGGAGNLGGGGLIGGGLSGGIGAGGTPFKIGKISMGDFFNTRFISQSDLLRQYLGGQHSFRHTNEFLRFGMSIQNGQIVMNDPHALMNAVSKDPRLANMIDVEGKLFETNLFKGEFAAFEKIIGNENANLRFSMLSGEAEANFRGKIGKDGVDIGVEANAGAYLARLQGTAELNGFRAMGDAYVGVTASGQAGVVFDPLNGDAKFTAKGELFIGAEAKGSIGYANDFFSVDLQGSVSAGAGVRGQFDVGLDNGKLKVDIGALGSLGVGGGAGLKVSVDLYKVADVVSDGVSSAFTGASDFISSIGTTSKLGNAIMKLF